MADPPRLYLEDIRAVSVLGRGAKGLVFRIHHSSPAAPGGRQVLALKVIARSPIKRKPRLEDHYRGICFERDVLSKLDHPLFPVLRGVLFTENVVGFAMDHCPGGNLASLRRRQTDQMFSEEVIRFYAAELVIALEHLHGLGIVYRDLKPDNILIQSDGHLMLVDFDLSTKLPPTTEMVPASPSQRKWTWNSDYSSSSSSDSYSSSSSSWCSTKLNSFVGTEEYVAPEVIEGKGHDQAIDWWGLGVVMYEMLYGKTPFRGQNRKETFYRILTKAPILLGDPTDLRDLIGRLLEKDPRARIGVERIKAHDFFKGLDWEGIVHVARPPFIPFQEEDDDDDVKIDVEHWVRSMSGASGEVGEGEEDGEEDKERVLSGSRVTVAPTCPAVAAWDNGYRRSIKENYGQSEFIEF